MKLNRKRLADTFQAYRNAQMDSKKKLSKEEVETIGKYGAKGQTYAGKTKGDMTIKKMKKSLKKYKNGGKVKGKC